MANDIDLHVGRRLRQRRCLLGLTQQKLAQAVGIKFQQIQKYESGANRISASRLWALAHALDMPVAHFFEGLSAPGETHLNGHHRPEAESAAMDAAIAPDVLSEKETIDLVRAYYTLEEQPRRRLLDLAKALAND